MKMENIIYLKVARNDTVIYYSLLGILYYNLKYIFFRHLEVS